MKSFYTGTMIACWAALVPMLVAMHPVDLEFFSLLVVIVANIYCVGGRYETL